MILTRCAVCATELGLTSGKKCGRCSTRYCGPECQVQHWQVGGHDQLCKKIKKAGGAEQYNANKKYTEAVSAAAEACADDTKGQTCYICTQALHWKTKEGLVRMCACRGTAGFAHVSCLAEQAKILCAEAEDNNLDVKVKQARFSRWSTCGLCEQHYHGVVRCALGWACWKTYVGRPEADWNRRSAMRMLAGGLYAAGHYEDALSVQEAGLLLMRRLGAPEELLLGTQSNLATTYASLGRHEQASQIERDVYSGRLKLHGEEHLQTLTAGLNYSASLVNLGRFETAKELSSKTLPVMRRVVGESHEITLRMQWNYAQSLYMDPATGLDGLHEALTTLEDLIRIARRVLGGEHPFTVEIEDSLRQVRAVLSAREGDVEPLREAVARVALRKAGGA
jgi:hypothetical protein